jgi:hypothetical protein
MYASSEMAFRQNVWLYLAGHTAVRHLFFSSPSAHACMKPGRLWCVAAAQSQWKKFHRLWSVQNYLFARAQSPQSQYTFNDLATNGDTGKVIRIIVRAKKKCVYSFVQLRPYGVGLWAMVKLVLISPPPMPSAEASKEGDSFGEATSRSRP